MQFLASLLVVLCVLVSGCDFDGGDTVYVDSTVLTVPDVPRSLSAVGSDESPLSSGRLPLKVEILPITDYTIFRSEGVGDLTTYASTGSDLNRWDDTAVENGTSYCYQVVAVNAIGAGEPFRYHFLCSCQCSRCSPEF